MRSGQQTAVRNSQPVKIFYEPFPEPVQGKVKGMCCIGNGCYIVLIDSTRTQEQQKHTLGHELAHIFLGHLDSGQDKSLTDMELEADKKAGEFYRLYAAGRLGATSTKIH